MAKKQKSVAPVVEEQQETRGEKEENHCRRCIAACVGTYCDSCQEFLELK